MNTPKRKPCLTGYSTYSCAGPTVKGEESFRCMRCTEKRNAAVRKEVAK